MDFKQWTPGEKHPDTPKNVYLNVYFWDKVRRILQGRCEICDFVISSDQTKVKELVFQCADDLCTCAEKAIGVQAHYVCHLCDDMYRAIYVNYGMANKNYFKEIDDKIRAERSDRNRKDRLGL